MPNTPLRPTLLQSVSLTALLLAAPAARAGTAFKSLAQALASASKAAQAAVSPAAGITASAQAALGAQNLTRATAQFHSLSAALAAAAKGAQAAPSPVVVDGYGPGHGLQAATGAASGNALWQGALTPDDPANVGGIVAGPSGVSITVKQTAPVARLNWQSFNVGAHTSLTFDQSRGGSLASSWIAINTVSDPTANPAQILGAIHAQGKVYVLDANGIAFSAGSTVNVGSLIAATAVIAGTQFGTDAAGQVSFNLYGALNPSLDVATGLNLYYNPTFVNGTASPITVEAGASIQTAAPSGTNLGGYVMLLGGNVANAGLIATPLGQTILSAGTAFTLRQGFSGSVTSGNIISTTLGSEIASSNTGTAGVFTTGSVANSGVVVADQGDITLDGHALTQSGVLLSTTTVNTRGTIHLLTPTDGSDPTSTVTLAANSVTEVQPEDNGQTELDSARAASVANSLIANAVRAGTAGTPTSTMPQLNNHDVLPDQLGESRVEVSAGGAIDIGAGALVQAQGGEIAVGGGNLVKLESGATLDVSGTNTALLPASINALLVNVQPFQLSESAANRTGGNLVTLGSGATQGVSGTNTALLPASINALLANVQPVQLSESAANRTGGLKGANVYVDARTLVEIASGTYAGNIYTPGGLLQVGGFLGQVPRTLSELTAIGGQVTLQALQTTLVPAPFGRVSPVNTPGTIVTDAGSTINVQGGSVSYAGGQVAQSYVQTTDGVIYDVNNAPANLVYTGVYGGFVVNYQRWHVTDIYNNPLLTPSAVTDPAYTVGRDAGTLTIAGATEQIAGHIFAGVTIGQNQSGPRPAGVTDPYLLAQSVLPQAGTLLVGNYQTGVLQPVTNPSSVTIGPVAAGAVPVQGSIALDSTILNASALANVTLSTGGNITVSAPVAVADGGTLSLTGTNLAIDASLTARSGAITLTDELLSQPVGTATSVTFAPNVVLDARGVLTNAQLDPSRLAGLGHANGGTVSIVTAGGVDLPAGARIDVSSGGGILASGALQPGTGGSVTVEGDVVLSGANAPRTAPVTLDAAFVGYGTAGGGTLTVEALDFEIGTTSLNSLSGTAVSLGSGFFNTGFSRYVVDGAQTLNVLPGAQVTAAEPIFVANGILDVPTGGDPSQAYTVTLPALYTPTRGSDVLSQRAGASISLLSVTNPTDTSLGGGGTVTIGAGAQVGVDSKQSIAVAGYDQVSVFGTLTAHAGTVAIGNTRYNNYNDTSSPIALSEFQTGVSDWIGVGSLIDVSGQAVVQTDQLGQRFGFASSGGTISLGGFNPANASQSTWAQVILRPGATIDADGASATVDIVPNTIESSTISVQPHPVTLAGAGGSIDANSFSGVALDGTILAHAGDAQVAGGSLTVQITPISLGAFSNIPTAVFQPRQILVSDQAVAVQPPTVQAGHTPPAATYGLARISQQQIDAAGFDAVTLDAEGGAVVFAGNVSLHTARSLTFGTGIVGDASPYGTVQITSPHVTFAGYSTSFDSMSGDLRPAEATLASFSTLSVSADLIDIGAIVDLGGSQNVANSQLGAMSGPGFGPPAPVVNTSGLGFTSASFSSTGDIRLRGLTDAVITTGGTLTSIGDLTLTAAQLYPTSGQSETILAGFNTVATEPATVGHTITVQGLGGAAPQAPYSIGGSLTLLADTILQDGVVRAPEGLITLSDGTQPNGGISEPSQVVLGPKSITSVSLAGQSVPYGGTVDGVSYQAPGGAPVGTFQPEVVVQAQSLDAADGAIIDLRGGGTLTGAGFIFGRGGTADVLTTPLLDTSGGVAVANARAQVTAIQPVRSGDAVYAILPGYQSAYAPAPTAGDSAYTATQTGERITVTAGEVPGLAAGTYTLLPAYYALQPGGYRVELTAGTQPLNTSLYEGNFTNAAPVTVSFAGTSISSPTPVAALFTSGTNVRQLSQYDEETYSQFEVANAALNGLPRPFLPQDAKTLLLRYPSVVGSLTALSIAPGDLLQTPDKGGYGATLEIDEQAERLGTLTVPTDLQIAQGDVVDPAVLSFSAATLSALDVPRLVIGGTLTAGGNSTQVATAGGTITIQADSANVTVLPHAVLSAGEILLTALPSSVLPTSNGNITVSPGATLTTIKVGPASYDSSDGYYFQAISSLRSFAEPVLDVSAGNVVFLPQTGSNPGASINVGTGSSVLAGGSLNFVAPSGTAANIGSATLGGAEIAIAVATINIGSGGNLPPGLDFSPQALSALLNGNAKASIPAVQQLVLTATDQVNIFGSVALNTGSTDLVLNTPAIYGVGVGTDVASISAAAFTWSGVEIAGGANTPFVSKPPGSPLVQPVMGQTSGTLLIQTTGAITLGYGPQTQPDAQTTLDRLVTGFADVTLQSATEITANNKSALSVYQTQPVSGQTDVGTLALVAPLVTTDSGAVLSLASGNVAISNPAGAATASTAGVTTLGGEIDIAAQTVSIGGAVALPSGRLSLTAAGDLAFLPGSVTDLSGRSVHLLDQTVSSPGGTLVAESTAGNIAVGGLADVSSPDAAAGRLSYSALAGDIDLAGTLRGTAASGQTPGGVVLLAGTLSTPTAAPASQVFGLINASLDTGGLFGTRIFEVGELSNGTVATPDIVIGNAANGTPLLVAHDISVTADLGGIDVTGTVDASGTGPGSIALQATGNVVLDAANGTPVLDAHASTTAVDSYGKPIDAENRAHVTLTSTAGSLLLEGGTIDLGYLGADGQAGTPVGELVLNAPRIGAVPATSGDVSIDAAAPLNITGAASIALYGWTRYLANDATGSIAQDSTVDPGASVTLAEINQDSTAFIDHAVANASLTARLAGLIGHDPSLFHLRPGVEIDSTAASGGNLTIVSDLDLSGLRYNDQGYGLGTTSVLGSGEPGSVAFRAQNNLFVNGSVTDGFGTPPDTGTAIPADNGWLTVSPRGSDPFHGDIYLPSTLVATLKTGGTVTSIALNKGSTFANKQPVSLNYAINIESTGLRSGISIPFGFTSAKAITVPAGGFLTTAAIRTPTLIPAGTILAAGTKIPANSVFSAGIIFPAAIKAQVMNGTLVPPGTPLDIFAGQLVLSQRLSDPLPTGAFIPAGSRPIFVSSDGLKLKSLSLRPEAYGGGTAQGYLYALAPLLPAGSLSWNLDFVAGANLASGNLDAVQARSVLKQQPGFGTFQGQGNLVLEDQHDFNPPGARGPVTPAFSVIRTGTGDLSLIAGGDFNQHSLYGIYTAGTQDPLPGGVAANAAYDLPRAGVNGQEIVKETSPDAVYNQIFANDYQAYYPTGGGDVQVTAQGSVTGQLFGGNITFNSPLNNLFTSDAVGNWLWRQGGAGTGEATAWWINFGSLAVSSNSTTDLVQLLGFQGIGALGGGNVLVAAGQDAGRTTEPTQQNLRSEGLIIAVGSTGRVLADGSVMVTGGGDIALDIGGTLNPVSETMPGSGGASPTLDGAITNLRGRTSIVAGAVGSIALSFNAPSSLGPFTPYFQNDLGLSDDGIEINPGDSVTTIRTMRDLVLDGVGDPGRIQDESYPLSSILFNGVVTQTAVETGFSLWTAATSINLFSSGGNVTPTTQPSTADVDPSNNVIVNDGVTDFHFVYPSQLYVTAATGNIVYSGGALIDNNPINVGVSLEIAPSTNEQVAFLAGQSIFAGGLAIDLSGANPAGLSTPASPTFSTPNLAVENGQPPPSNVRVGGGTQASPLSLFAQEPDTSTVPYLSAATQATPALFYAASGDIVGFTTGETEFFSAAAQETLAQWYLAAKPVRIEAGRDIFESGTVGLTAAGSLQQNQQTGGNFSFYTTSGNLFLNDNAQSISVVSAGRDITGSYFYVGGPGLLEVDAGRNITDTGGQGSIKSLGSLLAGAPISLTGGAGIEVAAGLGTGADYTAFADLYLNQANQANLALQITDPANTGKVQETYGPQLLAFLQQAYGYTGDQAGALAYFLNTANVPAANQDAFLRAVFYNELLASGQQYNDAASRFFGSYARGRDAIDALLPGDAGQQSKNGMPAGYAGGITMTSVASVSGTTTTTFDAGVATEHGGDIQVLDPGGQVILGTSGSVNPGGGTGLITNGFGNIDVFALGSVLLGKSRIFTNAGGNIQIWSAAGDINAGVGARTDVVFTPPVLVYDNVGGVVDSPAVPTSGAGISTQQPLPDIPPGNIDLTAPVGTIDAGEAGVRSSGNVNLVALHLSDTAGITAGGKTTGIVSAPSISASVAAAAGAAAGAATNAAQDINRPRTLAQEPSVIEVEVSVAPETDDERRRRHHV